MDKSKRGYKLVQLSKQSVVLQDLTKSVHNNQHLELDNFKDQQPENYDNIEGSRNYDLLEECRLTEELFNNEDGIILFDSSIEISTSFVNNIIEGEDNQSKTVQDQTYANLNTNKIDCNKNLEDGESASRTDNNEPENKNLLELGQSDTGIENGNIKENENLERTEDSDPSFEVEQEGENDSTDDEVMSDQGLQVEEREQENTSLDDDLGNQNVDRKRKKRKFSNPQEWKNNTIKRKREYGLDYTGRKGKEFKIKKPKKTLKDRCKCTKTNTKIQCFKISDEDREQMFKKFWKLKWPEKRIYVSSRVLSLPTVRARNRKENDSSQRSISYQYFLNKRNEQVRVCKTLFCNTLGVSVRTISAWIESDTKSPNKSDGSLTANQDNNIPRKKNLRFDKEKENLKAFFNALPKLESHYCRKTTSRLYLELHFRSKAELYQIYKDNWCVENKVNALSIKTFHEVFEELNLALYSPKKDECDVCVGYRTKNIEEQIYIEHIEKKNEARNERETVNFQIIKSLQWTYNLFSFVPSLTLRLYIIEQN